MKKNPTLIKNMPHVKLNEIPPLKGPDPQGIKACLLYTSPSPRDRTRSRMPSSA